MLKTEQRNENTRHIDRMTTQEMVHVMQTENMNAAFSVGAVEEELARAIDGIYENMQKGGRLFYVGCGTSGRLGILDASECSPTYGVPEDLVVGIIAGGDAAIRHAVEGAEDDADAGRKALQEKGLTESDSVVGISAAGGAAFVLGAVTYAKEKGAFTVGITSNAGSSLDRLAAVGIHPDTGAEVVTGSSRMKAGTAQKMILNMLSTGVMIRMGYVYENLMIHLRPSNIKLRDRMIRILAEILPLSYPEAEQALEKATWDIPTAIQSYKEKQA